MKRRLLFTAICAILLAAIISVSAAAGGDTQYILKQGDRGDGVTRLQVRLTQLGFFNGVVDGDYGEKTVEAVTEFQTYLATVDKYERYEPATPEPGEEEAAPTTAPADYVIDVSAMTSDVPITGIADGYTQEMLFDDTIDLFICEVSQSQKSLEAKRVQRRLISLNYLDDRADGEFGLNSVAALKKFQRLNGLPETGVTDADTRKILYSENAAISDKPIYNQMTQGSEGDVVYALQSRMLLLGFSSSNADGKYGTTSVRNVKALQNYLWILNNPMESTTGGVAYVDPDIAYDPEQRGYVSTGAAEPETIELMVDGHFVVYREDLSIGSENKQEVMRVQRRLYYLLYLDGSNAADGDYGDNTANAIKAFQERNGLPVTGTADEQTQLLLFSEDAIAEVKPYRIEVSIKNQRVYVFKPNANGEYTELYKTFVCSTGRNETPTPLGVFMYTSPSTNEWHFFTEFKSWAHYPFYIEGDIMFHSVLYNDKDDPKSLQTGTLKNLGKKASHGCIRLSVEDAKWIYENCPKRTTVEIYETK